MIFLCQLSYLPKLFGFVGRVRLELTTLWFTVKCLLNTCCVFPFFAQAYGIEPLLPSHEGCANRYTKAAFHFCFAKIYKIFLSSKYFKIFFLF